MQLTKTFHPFAIDWQQTNGTFCGYASVFETIDYQQEQVARGAFQKSLRRYKEEGSMPYMLWQHDMQKPVGVWKKLYEDRKGLFVEGQLLLDIRQAQEAYALIKAGAIRELSIGYRVLKSRKHKVLPCVVLEEVDLQEISLVTFAANPAARITDCKVARPFPFAECTSLIQQIQTMTRSMI